MKLWKDLLKSFLFNWLLYGTIMGTYYGVTEGVKEGVSFAVFGGIFFGAAMTGTLYWANKKSSKIALEIEEENKFLHSSKASHILKNGQATGLLFLAKQELLFITYEVKVLQYQIKIPLEAIDDVKELSKNPKGIEILKTDGTVEKLKVRSQKDWIIKIREAKDDLVE